MGVGVVLSIILRSLGFRFSENKGDSAKLRAYECGFDPFEDARGQFEVRFYRLAILFIVFDLEAIFLFPWVVCLDSIGMVGF